MEIVPKQLFTQNPYNAIISTMLALLLDTVRLSSVLPAIHIATVKTSLCFANKQNSSASCVIIRRIRVYCLPRAPLF